MADNNKSRIAAKEKGLCTGCRKPIDRVGVYCKACLIKERERHKKDRVWYIENGICPVCRKQKLFGDERSCLECSAKNYAFQQRYDKETLRKREKKYAGRRKEIREEYFKNGICFHCRKRKIEEGKKKCRFCLDKDAELHRNRRVNLRNVQVAKGMCYQCIKEKATKGKLCESCYNKAVENLAKGREKAEYYTTHRKLIKSILKR